MSPTPTTGNNDSNDDRDEEHDSFSSIRDSIIKDSTREKRNKDDGYFRISKTWLHTIGALLTANIITVVGVGISLYVDVQVLKKTAADQTSAIRSLQTFVYTILLSDDPRLTARKHLKSLTEEIE